MIKKMKLYIVSANGYEHPYSRMSQAERAKEQLAKFGVTAEITETVKEVEINI